MEEKNNSHHIIVSLHVTAKSPLLLSSGGPRVQRNSLGSMNRIFGTSKKVPKATLTDAIASVSFTAAGANCKNIDLTEFSSYALTDRRANRCH